MFSDVNAFSGFAVDDLAAAREFYERTLGIRVSDEMDGGLLRLHLAGGDRPTLIYPKPDFEPATYTRMPDGRYMAFSLDVLTLGEDGLIHEVCSFIIRSTESEEADFYQHWPRYPVDPDRFDTVFGRLGLPQYHPDYPAEGA